jgi:hypothetical protein
MVFRKALEVLLDCFPRNKPIWEYILFRHRIEGILKQWMTDLSEKTGVDTLLGPYSAYCLAVVKHKEVRGMFMQPSERDQLTGYLQSRLGNVQLRSTRSFPTTKAPSLCSVCRKTTSIRCPGRVPSPKTCLASQSTRRMTQLSSFKKSICGTLGADG